MNDQKQQIATKLKEANNILITVSASPTVDQLAACIGLTLILNKLDKHATAVFSGEVPSTIEFLKPDQTIEKTTDSLRDFIISLDKSKADKLRYKVEDDVVRIFITPYKTSISEKDLVFGQGDFNVDVVIGLGVHRQADLDSAITAHGRILHDAIIMCINNTPEPELGTINWLDLSASSLSELVAAMAPDLGQDVLDEQNATALLTGIVAETNHFGNMRTRPETMTVGAQLLAAGANQELVSSKLLLVDGQSGRQPADAAALSEPGTLAVPHLGLPAPQASDAAAGADGDSIDEVLKSLNGLMDGVDASSKTSIDNLMHSDRSKNRQVDPQDKTDTDSDKILTREDQYATKAPSITEDDMQALGIDTSPDPESKPEIGQPVVVSVEPAPQYNPDEKQGEQPKDGSWPNPDDAAASDEGTTESGGPDSGRESRTQEVDGAAATGAEPQEQQDTENSSESTGSGPSRQSDAPADSESLAPLQPLSMPQPLQMPPPQPPDQQSFGSQAPAMPSSEIDAKKNLSEIEEPPHTDSSDTSQSSATEDTGEAHVDSARKAVEDALKQANGESPLEPIIALGAQQVDLDLGHHQSDPEAGGQPNPRPQFGLGQVPSMPPPAPLGSTTAFSEPAPLGNSPADQPQTMPMPPGINIPPPETAPPTTIGLSPAGPPPPPSTPPPLA